MTKIDKAKMLQLLARGKTQADIARYFGVTTGAVCMMKKRIEKECKLPEVPPMAEATEETTQALVRGQEVNAVEQLKSINQKANRMLDELLGDEKILDEMVKAVEAMLTYDGDPGKQKKYIRRVVEKLNVNRDLALKAMSEIRKQLKLQLDIFQALHSMQASREFQEEVLEVVGEVDEDIKKEIVSRLNQRKALKMLTK